jgi:hypothetical protein
VQPPAPTSRVGQALGRLQDLLDDLSDAVAPAHRLKALG